jgi:hypothetical protein
MGPAFLQEGFVGKMPNPVAWLCAQPAFSLAFKRNSKRINRTSKKELIKLPQFPVMVDDDTLTLYHGDASSARAPAAQ